MRQDDFFAPLLELSRIARKKGNLVLSTDDIAKCFSGDYKKARNLIQKYMTSGLLTKLDHDSYIISNAGWIIIHNRKMREKLWSVFIIADKDRSRRSLFRKKGYYELTPNIFFKEFEPSDYTTAAQEDIILIVGKSDKLNTLWLHSYKNIWLGLTKLKEKIDSRINRIKRYSHIDPLDDYSVWAAIDYSKKTLDYIVLYLLTLFRKESLTSVTKVSLSAVHSLKNNIPENFYSALESLYTSSSNDKHPLYLLQKMINVILMLHDYVNLLHQERDQL